jgi:hypothetical protein
MGPGPSTWDILQEDFQRDWERQCKEIGDAYRTFVNAIDAFVEFARQFPADRFVDVAEAVIRRPEPVFDTFLKGVSGGFAKFLTEIPEKFPKILATWLLHIEVPEDQPLSLDSVFEGLLKKASITTDRVWGLVLSNPTVAEHLGWVLWAAERFDQGLPDIVKSGTDKRGLSLLAEVAQPVVDELEKRVLGAIPELVLKNLTGVVTAFELALKFMKKAKEIVRVLNKLVEGLDDLLAEKPEKLAGKVKEALDLAVPLILDLAATILPANLLKNLRDSVQKINVDELIKAAIAKIVTWAAAQVPMIGGKKRSGLLGAMKKFTYADGKKQSQHTAWLELEGRKVKLHVASGEVEAVSVGGPIGTDLKAVQEIVDKLEELKKQPNKGADVKAKTAELQKATDKLAAGFGPHGYDAAAFDKVMVVANGKPVSLKVYLEGAWCSQAPNASSNTCVPPTGTIVYGDFEHVMLANGNTENRATRGHAYITPMSVGGHSEFSSVPGWWDLLSYAPPRDLMAWQASHIIGGQLGGAGSPEYRNLLPLYRRANNPGMRTCETFARKLAEKCGLCVTYSVTPVYALPSVVGMVAVVAPLVPNAVRIEIVADSGPSTPNVYRVNVLVMNDPNANAPDECRLDKLPGGK